MLYNPYMKILLWSARLIAAAWVIVSVVVFAAVYIEWENGFHTERFLSAMQTASLCVIGLAILERLSLHLVDAPAVTLEKP